jgi:outer membrane protein TolC
MRRWHVTVLLLLFAPCAAQPAVAQLDQQAQTYDVTMEDCLAWTLTRNPDIQQLRADVERAAGTRLVFRSRALPQLAAQTTDGLRYGPLYPPAGLFSIVTAQFSQPLLDAGIPPSLRRGKVEVVIAQQNLNRTVTAILHEARVTFLRALYLRDLIALHEEIDQRLRANVDNEQQRLDVGTGSKAALANAKIQELNLELALANLRSDYFSMVTRVAELCGRDPGAGTNGVWQSRLPKPVGALQYERASVDWSHESAYALEHRADLKLFHALANAAAADKQTVQAGYFPLVSLTASGLFIPQNLFVSKQTDIVPGQDPRTSDLRAGVEMSWRVIDNGQVTGPSHRLEAIRQEYEITRQQLEQNIPRELAVIEGALESADARHDALLKSAEAAEENLRLIEAQLALGAATQLDFLKAQSDLLSVRVGLADATQSHEVARAELDRATGRYLEYRAAGVQ